jgi:sugar-phosphatase
MDGLLVDSEQLWQEAEVEILGALGVPLVAGACRLTKGMFVSEVARFWFERYPWSGPGPDEVAVRVVDRVIALVLETGRLQPGAEATLERCTRRGLPMAVASSSEYRLIEAVLEHFGIGHFFALVHSAEEEAYGKPHPGVFLTTAHRLAVAPERCLVFEDALAGVIAAKAARMACIAVPEASERERAAFAVADAVLTSLEAVDEPLLDRVAALHLGDPLAMPEAYGPVGNGPD